MQFKYRGKDYKTATDEDAGKHAKFTEVFRLEGLDEAVSNSWQLVLEAMDEDPAGADLLAKAKPILVKTMIAQASLGKVT